ncbi:hypothetical protein [Haloterrigena salinisoli]|uniref:hypothetical protein n=1 Tax=Haloterrigena salinisoli TaxID=3132747 RepID=UPI0030D18294
MSDEISRRTVLRNGSAGALSLGIAGLAGCTSSIPFIGGGDDIELDSWLFTPSLSDVFDDEDADPQEVTETNKQFTALVPEAVYENEDELITHYLLSVGSDLRNKTGVAAVDTDWIITQSIDWEYELDSSSYSRPRSGIADVRIVAGDFDAGAVETDLEKWVDDEYNGSGGGGYGDDGTDDETELEDAGSAPGFDLYEVENFAFGVSEDYLIEAETSLDAVAVVEAAIDAYENETGRWTEGDDGDKLLSELERGDYVSGELHRPRTVETRLEDNGYDDPDEASEEEREEAEEAIDDWESGLVGTTTTWNIDGDTTDIQGVFLYESDGDTDSDALSEHVDANRDYRQEWDTLEEYSISEAGRALVLTGVRRTRTLHSSH